MIRLLPIAALLAAASACTFDGSVLDSLAECSSEVDCKSPFKPHCVSGFCVAPAPGGPTEADAGPDGGSDVGDTEPASDAAADAQLPTDAGPLPVPFVTVPATALVGDRIDLDGSASTGSDLTYAWALRAPGGLGLQAEPNPEDPTRATMIPDVQGEWRVTLTLTDGIGRVVQSEGFEIDVTGFVTIDLPEGANDVYSVDGSVVWIAANGGAVKLVTATREIIVYPVDADRPSTSLVVADPFHAWFARTGGHAFRVMVEHELDHERPAIQQTLPRIGVVRSLSVATNGVAWFGGEDGIRRTQGGVLGSLGPALAFPEDDPNPNILSVLGLARGVWVGRRTGVCLVEDTSEREISCEPEQVIPDAGGEVYDLVSAMAVASDGTLWVGTDGQGLYRKAEEGFTGITPGAGSGLPAGTIRDLAPAADGDLWGATPTGLFRVYAATGKVTTFGEGSGLEDLGEVRAVHVTRGEAPQVWVATASGVAFLAP
jgi:hypothetical protein